MSALPIHVDALLALRRRVEALLDDDPSATDLASRVARAALLGASAGLLLTRARRGLRWPPGLPAIAVGGALLGGSGKTPVAIACTLHLARRGVPTTLVGHGYGGTTRAALRVDPETPVALVGDEAVVAARVLARVVGAEVVVGPTRDAAIAHALANGARVVVLDGLLAPVGAQGQRPALTLLARPVGVAAPLADRLARHVDEVVWLGDPSCPERLELVRGQEVHALTELRDTRYGLVTALARPSRVARLLAASPLARAPEVTLALGNHGSLTPADHEAARALSARAGLGLWIATEKGPLLHASSFGGRPLALLRHGVTLPAPVRARLDALARQVIATP